MQSIIDYFNKYPLVQRLGSRGEELDYILTRHQPLDEDEKKLIDTTQYYSHLKALHSYLSIGIPYISSLLQVLFISLVNYKITRLLPWIFIGCQS